LHGGAQRGVGSIRERPKGLPASPFTQRLRTLIEGGRLIAAEWLTADAEQAQPLALLLTFARSELRVRIVADFDQQAPNLFLLRDDDTVAGAADERARRERFRGAAPYTLGRGRGVTIPGDADALAQLGQQLVANTAQRSDDAALQQRRSQLKAALKRADRKVAAIEGDLARTALAPKLREEAQALLCHLDAVPRGASSVVVPDPLDEQRSLTIALDPSKDARRNAEQRFERARKLERGVAIAEARLAEARVEAAQLREKLAHLEQHGLPPSERPIAAAAPRSRKKPPARTPYRTFVGHGEKVVFVGKGAADNDTLTLTVARPHDHWLHVRDASGSHVVVPLDRGATIPQELLLDAAHLAAHFSSVRGEPRVEIAHTSRRFVRKLKGSAPGSVNVDRERVFVLLVEPARIARLLASERS
jgi:predicted ribosome quality control (RQC) complex YloA/Tae2 family protein